MEDKYTYGHRDGLNLQNCIRVHTMRATKSDKRGTTCGYSVWIGWAMMPDHGRYGPKAPPEAVCIMAFPEDIHHGIANEDDLVDVRKAINKTLRRIRQVNAPHRLGIIEAKRKIREENVR